MHRNVTVLPCIYTVFFAVLQYAVGFQWTRWTQCWLADERSFEKMNTELTVGERSVDDKKNTVLTSTSAQGWLVDQHSVG